ncbi:MAG: hypothetical protein ACK56I_33015, partial [bacterium]
MPPPGAGPAWRGAAPAGSGESPRRWSRNARRRGGWPRAGPAAGPACRRASLASGSTMTRRRGLDLDGPGDCDVESEAIRRLIAGLDGPPGRVPGDLPGVDGLAAPASCATKEQKHAVERKEPARGTKAEKQCGV